MNAVFNIITGIAGRLTTENQVNEVSNVLLLAEYNIFIIMQIMQQL